MALSPCPSLKGSLILFKKKEGRAWVCLPEGQAQRGLSCPHFLPVIVGVSSMAFPFDASVMWLELPLAIACQGGWILLEGGSGM